MKKFRQFDPKLFANQQPLPKKNKYILCYCKDDDPTSPFDEAVCVGYLKYAAGDKSSPMIITPFGRGQVVAWCDCLPKDFQWPGLTKMLPIEHVEKYDYTEYNATRNTMLHGIQCGDKNDGRKN
jgi:hypothetical protein